MASGSFQSLIATPSVSLAMIATGSNPDGTTGVHGGVGGSLAQLDQAASLTPLAITKSVAVGNPALGAEWTVAVPAGKAWYLRSITALLTASAVVANRVPWFFIKDAAANQVMALTFTTPATASGTFTYQAAEGMPAETTSFGTVMRALPSGLVLPTGWTISTVTVSKDAGDQWSAIRLMVVEETVS